MGADPGLHVFAVSKRVMGIEPTTTTLATWRSTTELHPQKRPTNEYKSPSRQIKPTIAVLAGRGVGSRRIDCLRDRAVRARPTIIPAMRIPLLIVAYCLVVPAAAGLLMLYDGRHELTALTILNVSNDPTRELWRDVNARFVADYAEETGLRVAVRQSHGGSASQARSVIDGLPADVVTLALWDDTDRLRVKGLLAANWEKRQPHNSSPYYSTIVFVVRRGNPKNIHDWPDLVRDGVAVITPNPKISGNGKLSFLAAWGSVRRRSGSDDEARDFVTELYRHVPVLDTGARGATTTFAQNGIGDVQLTWENEAHLEVRESEGALEIVYPPASIRAEPPVAVVDRNVDENGTRAVAEAYVQALFRPDYQELLAKHHFRPIDDAVMAKVRSRFPEIELFTIDIIAQDWNEAQKRFFAAGGEFDRMFQQQ